MLPTVLISHIPSRSGPVTGPTPRIGAVGAAEERRKAQDGPVVQGVNDF